MPARHTPRPEETPAQLLQKHFGFAEFRPGQQTVIDALHANKAALAVFPTGAGKSLCYQLPALRYEGLTLVVSPLIALMKDQIDFLVRHGIAAARLDSSLSGPETRAVTERMEAGTLKLLYVAPGAVQQRAVSGAARADADRAVRRGRGALHLGVGP